MDLNLLKTFDVVMKTRSVNKAAESLDITAPAVSHALNRLREQYNDRLFIRQGRGIVPTNFALELYAEIQEPLGLLMSGAKSRQSFNAPTSQRTFRISSHKDIDLMVVPSLNRYRDTHAPFVQFQADIEHLNEEDRQNDLRTRKVDLILATVPLEDHGYQNQLLVEQELVVVCSRNHPRIQDSLSQEQFFTERHLLWSTQRMNSDILSSLSSNTLPSRDIAYATSSLCTAIMMAAQTEWLCVCSRWHAESMSKHLEITTHHLPFELQRIPVYMTWHQSQQSDTGHQWLKEAMVQSTAHLSYP
jgi:LysR family transcriptional regulator, transcriptional activator for leuABCD operon